MKRKAENRRARFDVAVERTLEAGLVLTGDEVKAVRADRAQLTGAYVKLMEGARSLPRPVLVGAHLATAAEPDRTRDLLLKAKEIRELRDAVSRGGATAVPLELRLSGGWVKLLIGVGSGRKAKDKRELLKSRDLDREAAQSR